ncbi:hypothetical protein HanHA300_Chr10g0353331 [Helianthus annuus]|nr:hypothetical protein HanHA300_Chr10g0353331 [Helianthus annuus]KAJ0529201.1 hypothetical protein HanHA89_Chr10g0375071 [Helianthus annuus]KAJ0696082.1 hypothetical protein HanLR1_Chr10g0352901 [Helianthus annuus]
MASRTVLQFMDCGNKSIGKVYLGNSVTKCVWKGAFMWQQSIQKKVIGSCWS